MRTKLRSCTAVITASLLFAACQGDDTEEEAASMTTPLGDEVGLFAAADAPVRASASDTSAVEVGVRFRSDVAGVVTGIRFYKGSANVGTHAGHLWSSRGRLLATATFTQETATGWQTVRFASPVSVRAGSTYVASYHTDVGRYAADWDYFANRSIDRAPLHALADDGRSRNGVYSYGASAFPTRSSRATNYWVDVLFRPADGAPSPTEDAGVVTIDGGADTGTGATDAGTAPVADAGPIVHGKDIGASNTGVPAGTTLTPVSGSVVLSTPGQIWEGKELTGTIKVTADNVTIRNCKIHSTGYFGISNQGKNLLVERCEVTGDAGQYTGIVADDATVRRCDIHHFENPLVVSSNAIVEENYIHDLDYHDPAAHPDGIEWASGGSSSVIRRNRIVIGAHTACVNLTPYSGGAANNNTVEDNFFAGGTYSLYIRGDGGGTVNGVAVRGNVWAKGSYAYGPASIVAVSNLTWENNRLDDGTPIAR